MKISLATVINGNFKIEAEYSQEQLQTAIVAFHTKCASLWNASDVEKATVQILDENLSVVAGKSEVIIHPIVEPVD